MGSVCEYLNEGNARVPAYVYMPCYLGWGQSIHRPGPYAGFLGKRYDPLFTDYRFEFPKFLRSFISSRTPVFIVYT